MKKLYFVLVLTVIVLLCGCAEDKVVSEPGRHAMSFNKSIKKDISLNYWLYLPADYGKAEKKWPLMMFLHGAGERGDDLNQVLAHGPARLASEDKDFPFIIISPQCPKGDWWGNKADELVALCDHVADTYAVDENRLYITGLSMGGYGTWQVIGMYPNKFAAAAPVCGGGNTAIAKHYMKDIPIWVFHGGKDNVVPLRKSEEMVDALKKCGNKKVKFTVYHEAGHDSWTETYNNPELYEWFLEQHLADPKL